MCIRDRLILLSPSVRKNSLKKWKNSVSLISWHGLPARENTAKMAVPQSENSSVK